MWSCLELRFSSPKKEGKEKKEGGQNSLPSQAQKEDDVVALHVLFSPLEIWGQIILTTCLLLYFVITWYFW